MPSRRILIRTLRFVTSLGKCPDLSWINPQLSISGSLHPRQYASLRQMGIGAIVDLREEGKDDESLLAEHGIRFLHLPAPNYSVPSQTQLIQSSDWVLRQMDAGRKALIHCKEGVGRSVVLACCVLMRQGSGLADALRLVKARRWGVALSTRQMDALEQVGRLLARPDSAYRMHLASKAGDN